MEKVTPIMRLPFMRVFCSAIGHDYIVTRKITNHINEYKCASCGKEVSDNYSGKYEELTYKRREINECLSSFFEKKRRISLP